MAILQQIRSLFRLDKKTLSLDPDFTDVLGLYMNEPPMIPQPVYTGCLHGDSLNASVQQSIHFDNAPVDVVHVSPGSHF